MAEYRKTPEAVDKLTREQYLVTQEGATERPGTGALLQEKRPGIYVDIVSGEALFASSRKYEPGCAGPSFPNPTRSDTLREVDDTSHGMSRTEVRSAHAD